MTKLWKCKINIPQECHLFLKKKKNHSPYYTSCFGKTVTDASLELAFSVSNHLCRQVQLVVRQFCLGYRLGTYLGVSCSLCLPLFLIEAHWFLYCSYGYGVFIYELVQLEFLGGFRKHQRVFFLFNFQQGTETVL